MYWFVINLLLSLCEGFTSPEVVQVSNNGSTPGTPRRRSAALDPTSTRRKLSASKEQKVNVEALNELNKKNKTASDSSLVTTRGNDRTLRDTPKSTTTAFKTDTPKVEVSNSPEKFSMETKVSERTTQRSPSPLSQEKRSFSMTRQEAVSNIKKSRGLLNGEAKVNGDDKIMTTAKPPLVASKEPPVASKPPTAKSYDRDSKSNSLRTMNSKDEHPSVTDIKDAAKQDSALNQPSRRISQYRLSGSEALHIFHPTRRSVVPKSGDFSDATALEQIDDSRTISPAPPPSKSPVLDRRVTKRDSKLAVSVTEEKPTQQEAPAPPKSPSTSSVTGARRPVVVEKLAQLKTDEEAPAHQEPPAPPKSPGSSVPGARRPGVVESKQKKMLALMGKEASVDTDRPTEIPRTTPVSVQHCVLRYTNCATVLLGTSRARSTDTCRRASSH